MAIDSLAIFKSTFAAIPLVSTGVWTTNFSDWTDGRVTSKAVGTLITNAAPPFTFSKSTFKAQLDALAPTASEATGASNFASAWETAVLASTFITLPGDFTGAATPATTWSVVTTSLIDVASITAAKAQLITDLTNAAKVADVNNSDFPQAFRDAFLNLTVSVTGINSVVPVPSPLNVLNAPLI